MLNFMNFPHRVLIHRASNVLDDWGMPVISNTSILVKCRISDNIESIKLSGDKNETYVPKYSISFPNDVEVFEDDEIEIDNKLYSISQIKTYRDVSGSRMLLKVWI